MSSILYFSKTEVGPYTRPKKYSKRQNKKDKSNQIEKKKLKKKSSLSNFFKSPKNVENKICDFTFIASEPADIDSSYLSSYSISESSNPLLSYNQKLSNDTLTTVATNHKYPNTDINPEISDRVSKKFGKHSSEYSDNNIYPSLLNIEAVANILSGNHINDKAYDSQETFIQFENPIVDPLKVLDNISGANDYKVFKDDSKKHKKRHKNPNHKKESKSMKFQPKPEYSSKISSSATPSTTEEPKYFVSSKQYCSNESTTRTHNRILKNLTCKFGGNNIFNKTEKHKAFETFGNKYQQNDENQGDYFNKLKDNKESILHENNTSDNYEIDLDFSFNDDASILESEINKCVSPMSFDGFSITNFSPSNTSSTSIQHFFENQETIPENDSGICSVDVNSATTPAEDLINSNDIDSIISDFDDNNYEKETEKKFEILAKRELNIIPQTSSNSIFDFVKSTKKIMRLGSCRKKNETHDLKNSIKSKTREEKVHIDVPTFRNSKKALSEIFNSLITGTLHSGSLKEYTKGSTSDYSDTPDLIDIHDPRTFFQDRNSVVKSEKEKKTPCIQFKNTSQLFVYNKSGDDIESRTSRDASNIQKIVGDETSVSKTGKSILKKRENKNIMFEKTRSYFEDMETFDDFIRKLDRSDQERMCKEIFNNKKRESQLSNYYKFYDKFKK